MKTVKLIIVAVIIAALGYGIYRIVEKSEPTPNPPGFEVPEGCDLESTQNYVEFELSKIKDTDFDGLKKRYEELGALLKKEMDDAPQCLAVVTLNLRGVYLKRFVQMSDKEFSAAKWPNYLSIDRMNKSLKEELSKENADLNRIENTLNEYKKVLSYNERVKRQSAQRPKTIKSEWNYKNTKSIIDERRPDVNEAVNHTDEYKNTDKNNVKTRIYKGHVRFLESLVVLLENGINDDVVSEEWKNNDRELVAKEIELFAQRARDYYDASNTDVQSVSERLFEKLTFLTTEVERIENERIENERKAQADSLEYDLKNYQENENN